VTGSTVSRAVTRLIWVGATLAALPGAVPAEGASLRLYNWVDYIDPGVVADFEAETGIDVVIESYTSSEQAETRLLLGGQGFDLVVVYSQQVDRLAHAGAIEPFDRSAMPNAVGIDTSILSMMPGAAADLSLAMPYFWGTTGIGYNMDALAERFPEGAPRSWDLIFDPATAKRVEDCGVHVIDAPETVIGAALAWLGRDPRSQAPEDIEAAMTAIEAAAPHWRAIDSELINALATGASCVTLAWSTEVLLAMDSAKEGLSVDYILPKEGSEIWVDSFVIPAGAPNREEAHRFVDFLLRSDIAARLTNWSYAANAVPAANSMVDPAILADPRVYPLEADREHFFPLSSFAAELQSEVNSRWMWLKLPM
jgi:putrescine transport system substrate-binding protein